MVYPMQMVLAGIPVASRYAQIPGKWMGTDIGRLS